jgi:hypothetical protein
MVDGEMVADDRPGMDVDAGLGMGVLGKHPWEDRNAQPVAVRARSGSTALPSTGGPVHPARCQADALDVPSADTAFVFRRHLHEAPDYVVRFLSLVLQEGEVDGGKVCNPFCPGRIAVDHVVQGGNQVILLGRVLLKHY